MSITANIAARDRHTALLRGARPAAATNVAMTASQAQETLFGWVYKQPGMATYTDCREIVARIAAERGTEDTIALLQRFGCHRLTDLFIGSYSGFFECAKAVLYYGISPAHSWRTFSDIPGDLRDRWLLWHDASDCLWEVRGALGTELDDGTVDDVSGKEAFEKRYAEQRAGG